MDKKVIMLWRDDFVDEKAWNAICEILEMPADTQQAEIHTTQVFHLPYKH